MESMIKFNPNPEYRLMNKKDHHPIYHLDKKYDFMMLLKAASTNLFKTSH